MTPAPTMTTPREEISRALRNLWDGDIDKMDDATYLAACADAVIAALSTEAAVERAAEIMVGSVVGKFSPRELAQRAIGALLGTGEAP